MLKPGDVIYRRDPRRPLTEAQKEELRRLAEMPDDTIDFSDIPPLDDAFWENAVRFSERPRAKATDNKARKR
jgi:hypothetical protein